MIYIPIVSRISRSVARDEGTLFTSDALISTWLPRIAHADGYFSIFTFHVIFSRRGLRKVSPRCAECGDVIRGKKSGTSGQILATTRSIWPRDSSGRLFRALAFPCISPLPCLTVKWPFRRNVRSIGCRSSCRCGRRRRQIWFSGICDTWRSAQPRPFCVSPNASVSCLRGSAPHLAFVCKQITNC